MLAFVAPRMMAGLTALGVLFVRPLERVVGLSQGGYLDEGLVVVCLLALPFRRVVMRKTLRTFPGSGGSPGSGWPAC